MKIMELVENTEFDYIDLYSSLKVELTDYLDDDDKEKINTWVRIDLENGAKESAEDLFYSNVDDYIFERTNLGEDLISKEQIIERLTSLNEYKLADNIKFCIRVKKALTE